MRGLADAASACSAARFLEALLPPAVVDRFEWQLSTQCLDERISDTQTPADEIAAWRIGCNKAHVKANWRFSAKEGPALPGSISDSARTSPSSPRITVDAILGRYNRTIQL
jgi:hypothetical protein